MYIAVNVKDAIEEEMKKRIAMGLRRSEIMRQALCTHFGLEKRDE